MSNEVDCFRQRSSRWQAARPRNTLSVAFLLECLANGMSVAEIVDAYPTLA